MNLDTLQRRFRAVALAVAAPRGSQRIGSGRDLRAWTVDAFTEQLDRLRRSARAYADRLGTLDEVLRDLENVEQAGAHLIAALVNGRDFRRVLQIGERIDALRATVRAMVRARVREVLGP